MRLFIYKTLFIFLCIIITFKLTFGAIVENFKTDLYNIKSKENVILIKNKIRDELKNAIKKDKILNQEDAILLKKLFEKINFEIDNAN